MRFAARRNQDDVRCSRALIQPSSLMISLRLRLRLRLQLSPAVGIYLHPPDTQKLNPPTLGQRQPEARGSSFLLPVVRVRAAARPGGGLPQLRADGSLRPRRCRRSPTRSLPQPEEPSDVAAAESGPRLGVALRLLASGRLFAHQERADVLEAVPERAAARHEVGRVVPTTLRAMIRSREHRDTAQRKQTLSTRANFWNFAAAFFGKCVFVRVLCTLEQSPLDEMNQPSLTARSQIIIPLHTLSLLPTRAIFFKVFLGG